MNQSAARPFDVRSVIRGSRLASVLSRRSNCVWLDHWSGRITLYIARTTGIATQLAWPGPIAAPAIPGTPLRSWFSLPSTACGPHALISALDQALLADPSAGKKPGIIQLMTRVLSTDALHQCGRDRRHPVSLETPRNPSHILLIDERNTSATNIHASATARSKAFASMIQAACAAHPDAEFWLIRSGDPGSGPWLSASSSLPANIRLLTPPYSLAEALRHVERVFVVEASEGICGLLADVPTHVFGTPYYAGWGLTHDHAGLPSRRARPTLAALFDVVFLRFVRYLDPSTLAHGPLESVLDSIELQHEVAQRFTDLQSVVAIRFQRWKRPFATPFLTAGGGRLRWTQELESVRTGECVALWGARPTENIAPNVPHVRIEDGFIHSLGLGSDMSAPYSHVLDRRGLYFDARQPSDLTILLNETEFSDAELARAAVLREQLVRLGITKYNLGRRPPAWQAPSDRQVVLVPGQVADDASIRLGTQGLCTADALLREVRARRPHAFIVYKPHPDVLSGNRNGVIDVSGLADVIDSDADLLSLIEAADEIHTLSSLSGFDALLRNKAVFTYGLPFYAGWGLTHDMLVQPWRKRRLTLDMLAAGVLLRYPVYWDWKLGIFTTPEAVVHQLALPAARPLDKIRGNRTRPLIKALRWTRNAFRYAVWQSRQKNNGNDDDFTY
ncbi:capsular polysaccharide biosynthesis protein [Burkholderia pyrrocinia]|uniref:capsular polysaccharide biosynthesis protein n=1 Tax=Burkholderia pyrrocinia TaxID=60550 RepID=UPI00064BE469|nr:capsular biosynthesis protein [Burkholderia pyrrocinia]AKM00402.1 capsular biosynthesis protein [Burkholderia pyrrocinia]